MPDGEGCDDGRYKLWAITPDAEWFAKEKLVVCTVFFTKDPNDVESRPWSLLPSPVIIILIFPPLEDGVLANI